jgi:ABC-2 type transport system ATP-binding protein
VNGTAGLLTESPGLWDTLSVRLNLLTYARLHALPDPNARVDAGLAAMELFDRAGDRAGELSKGLKQRVAIARALLHDPAVILLDEPTSGLDPASARHIRDIIAGLGRQGRAVLISTHNLGEAEALADRIGILKVRLLALDAPARLRQQAGGTHVDIGVEGDASAWTTMLTDRLGRRAEAYGSRLQVILGDGDSVADVVAVLVTAGARLVSVVPHSRTLEDVYLGLVGTA